MVTICSAVVSAGADRIAKDLPPGTIHMPDNLRAFAPDPDGEDSYPIVTYSWLLLYKTYDNPQKVVALKNYVTWCLTEGQAFNESLGFVRLPPQVVSRAVRAVDSVH